MNEGYAGSQRMFVLNELKRYFKEVNNSRYYVRRGPINWSQFNYDNRPFAISISCDESSFMHIGNQTMIISVEMMMKMRKEADLRELNIDDTGLDQLTVDLQEVVGRLECAKQPASNRQDYDSVVMRIDHTNDKVVEIADLSQGLQGIWATFMVDF